MESEKELNTKIMEITMSIQEKYPELYEHLGEMRVTLPDVKNPEINSKNLAAYYESLNSLLKHYERDHLPEVAKHNKITVEISLPFRLNDNRI